MPKKFYEFDSANVELSSQTDSTLIEDVVHATEVSEFFHNDSVGMALMANAKTNAFAGFHEITRAANIEDAIEVLKRRWTDLKMMEYLVRYADAAMNIGDVAQEILNERDKSED